jgi:iron complex transport system ATP-binding protein
MISMPLIDVRSLCFSYREKNVLSDISFSIQSSETWSIIGPNGAGKSTLIKCIAGLAKPQSGIVLINGTDIAKINPRDRAKTISYVPQASNRNLAAYSVFDFVMLGRFPYQGLMAVSTSGDIEIVTDALKLTDVYDLRDRLLTSLSGGELQRVFLAGAVAQQSKILLLDEPSTFLDPLHQLLVSKTLERIHKEFGTVIITITHDVNAAITRFSNVLALVDKKMFYAGSAAIFRERCPKILTDVFGIVFGEATVKNASRVVMICDEATP